jgi:CheY-like chemotaxis protein
MGVNIEPETILLVDDCEDDVFFLKRALSRAGLDHPVAVVPNGRADIDYLRGEGQPVFPNLCAVVTELFPWENGFEWLQWIRAQPHLEGLPLIVLTASLRKKDFELAEELGANKVCHKTCNPDHLQEVVAYIAELICQQAPAFAPEPRTGIPKAPEPDASELLATLAARLK